MVLTGSVLESECPKSLGRKIKIRQQQQHQQQHQQQQIGEALPVGGGGGGSRSVLAASAGRTGSVGLAAAGIMSDDSGLFVTKRSILGHNGATTTAVNITSRQPLRKILVESRCASTSISSASLESGAGGAGSTGSRSRNTPSTSWPSNGAAGSVGGGGGGSGNNAAAGAKRQQQQQQQQRGRAKDVLTAGASSSSSKSAGRPRTPSPVLARPSIGKSASVPANLRDDAGAPAGKEASASSGILKRSSSFFEGRSLRALLLRRRRRPAKLPSPELPRKSVSFSADTSFRESAKGRSAGRKTAALHESKLYRKGVLQDRNGCCDEQPAALGSARAAANLPLAWETSLGGPAALLGAAQDGDDELIRRIVARAAEPGLGELLDVNAVDNSGRTAISHLAGNGSALMLEACLSLRAADANLPDNEGNTPLHFAAQAGQTECLNILLQRCQSIEVDARNSLGFTPLMKAALQGRTKCAKILLFAGANPTLRDHGRGLRAEQWARFCGRYVCAEVIERFARHRLLEKSTSCRWGSEPELAAQVFQGKLMPIPSSPMQQQHQQQHQQAPASGLKSKIRRVFRTSSGSDKSFSLVSQLTSAALCASSPVLPKPGDVSPVVKSLLRPLSVPQLRITLVTPQEIIEKVGSDKSYVQSVNFAEKIESTMVKPPRAKKKSK